MLIVVSPCAQLLQLLKILIVTVRMSVYGVSWCVKIGTLSAWNTLVRCPRSVAHAVLTTFLKKIRTDEKRWGAVTSLRSRAP